MTSRRRRDVRFVLVSYHHTCQALRTAWQGQGPPSWAVWLCCMLNVVGNRRAHATCHASLQGSSRTRASLRSACTASAPCASRSGCDSPSEASVTTCVCLPDTCSLRDASCVVRVSPPWWNCIGSTGHSRDATRQGRHPYAQAERLSAVPQTHAEPAGLQGRQEVRPVGCHSL